PPARAVRELAMRGFDRTDRPYAEAETELGAFGKGELQQQQRDERVVEGAVHTLLLVADGGPQRLLGERMLALHARDGLVEGPLGVRPVAESSRTDDVGDHSNDHADDPSTNNRELFPGRL